LNAVFGVDLGQQGKTFGFASWKISLSGGSFGFLLHEAPIARSRTIRRTSTSRAGFRNLDRLSQNFVSMLILELDLTEEEPSM
jgi:hypothetical protein